MNRRKSLAIAVSVAFAAVVGACGKKEEAAPKAEAPQKAAEVQTVRIGSRIAAHRSAGAYRHRHPQRRAARDRRRQRGGHRDRRQESEDSRWSPRTTRRIPTKATTVAPEARRLQGRRRGGALQFGRVDPGLEDLFGRGHSADLAFVHQSEVHACRASRPRSASSLMTTSRARHSAGSRSTTSRRRRSP